MKARQFISLLLAALLLTSCGGESGEVTESQPTDTTEPEVTTAEAVIPERDFNGYNFNILNGNVYSWFTVSNVTTEEENGDTMNDAIYQRNRKVEERYRSR